MACAASPSNATRPETNVGSGGCSCSVSVTCTVSGGVALISAATLGCQSARRASSQRCHAAGSSGGAPERAVRQVEYQ